MDASTKRALAVLAGITLCAQLALAYDPAGREEFVFAEKAESLQKFGYDSFCPDTKTFACRNRLPYDKYVGTKGYFLSDKPTHSDVFGYEFYPVVLESGDEYFYVSRKKDGKFGALSPIIPLSQFQELKSFTAEPLVAGSPIVLTKVEQSYGVRTYALSNGKTLNDGKLKNIRALVARFGGKALLAELLLDAEIERDEIEDRYFIQPSGSLLRPDARLYIGVNAQKTWLRFKVKYYGDDWLFVSGYKVAADSYRWQSPKLDFERDHSSGSVWEWVDVAAGAKEIEVARALSSAQQAAIRFQGNQYYDDVTLEEDQKQSIKTILAIYKEIGGAT